MLKELEDIGPIKDRVILREHLDMAIEVNNEIIPQEHEEIEKEELVETIEEQKK